MAEKTIIPVSLNNEHHESLIQYIEEVTEKFSGNRSKAMREIIRIAMREGTQDETENTLLEVKKQLNEIRAILARIQREGTKEKTSSEMTQPEMTQPKPPEPIPDKYETKLKRLENL